MIKYTLFKQVKVRYSDRGKGHVLVLLHGFLEDLEMWDDFSKELSKFFRVICIDLPGFGETPAIGFVLTMELGANCVKAVLDKEKLKRYVIVGHSMGGYVALAFSDLFRDNVKGLGLFHSTALDDSPEKKESRDKSISLVKKNPGKYIEIFFAGLFAPLNVPRFRSEINVFQKRAKGLTKQAIVNTLEGMKDRKRMDWVLEMAEFPVLFIIGKYDAAIPYEPVLNQVQLVKDPTVLFLENAGHMGFLEERELTLSAVKKFTRRAFVGSPMISAIVPI